MSFTISINDQAAFEVLFAGPAGPTGPQGPQGPQGTPGVGVPTGGTAGQFLAKVDGTNYNTAWTTLNLEGYATESWVTAGFYPLTGNPSGFLTSSALTPYLTISSAAATYQTLSGMSDYLSKAGNLSGLTNLATARDNLNLGTANTPVFAGLTAQGSGANLANLTPTSLSITNATSGSFTIQPSVGITFPDASIQTTAFSTSLLTPYALINSQVFTGTPSLPTGTIGVTQVTGTSTTSLATTAFVQQELAAGTAVAKNLEVLVRNQSGSTIAAGSIVYISGATGNLPLITLAQANNDQNSAQTMGFVKTDITNNGTGYVIVRGTLENINTSAVAEGVQLYLSPTTPGAWTTTKPVAPQHMVYVGIVIRSHPNLGTILVAVQNGLELDELHDVLITTPSTGQVLTYDAVSGLWKNQAAAGGAVWGGITGTLSSQTDLQSALNAKANLAGATFTGKVNMTPVAGVAGMNVGIGGTSAASTTAGDLWIATGGANLNFRDGTGAWRILVNTSNTNTFSASQIIDTTSSTAALRVTQKGTGNAIEVEDSTTPDATRFTVDQFGKVGVGVAPDATAALKVDTNGIMFGDGTTQTTSAAPFTGGAVTSAITANSGSNDSYFFHDKIETYVGSFRVVMSTDVSYPGFAIYTGSSVAPSIFINAGGIQFPDSSYQTTAYIDAPSDGNYYVRKDGAWVQCTVVSIYNSTDDTSYNCLTV